VVVLADAERGHDADARDRDEGPAHGVRETGHALEPFMAGWNRSAGGNSIPRSRGSVKVVPGVGPSRSPMDLGRIDPATGRPGLLSNPESTTGNLSSVVLPGAKQTGVSRWRAPILSARSADGTPSTFATLR